jgi:hypothetical protein
VQSNGQFHGSIAFQIGLPKLQDSFLDCEGEWRLDKSAIHKLGPERPKVEGETKGCLAEQFVGIFAELEAGVENEMAICDVK